MVLKLCHASKSRGEIVKTQVARPHLQSLRFRRYEVGPGFCILNKFLGDAYDVGQRITLRITDIMNE